MTSLTDINDTRVDMDIHGAGLEQAQARFKALKSLAHEIETEPCSIAYETDSADDDTVIHAHFDFSCAAEKLIFQLNYMYNSRYKACS
ncbi:MAG: DUF406 family protein [Endozoicomonas sp.]